MMSPSPSFPVFYLCFGMVDMLLALFLLMLNVSFVRSLCKHNQRLFGNLTTFLSVLITTLFGMFPILATLSCLVHVYGYTDYSHEELLIVEHQIMIPASPLYWTSQSLMVLLFVVRIKKVFANSELALGRPAMRCLYFTSALLVLLSTSITVPLALDYGETFIFLGMLLVWTAVHFTMSVTLIVLFMNRMNRVILTRARMESKQSAEVSDTTSTGTTDSAVTIKNDLLFRVAVKHNILVRFAIVSSVISFLCAFGILAINNTSIRFMAGTVYAFDCAISATCIYLLFACHEHVYSVLCFAIHRRCENSKARKLQSAI